MANKFPYSKAVRKLNPTNQEIQHQVNLGIGTFEQHGRVFLKKTKRIR